MRTCTSCQKQIPDDARTCAFCGAAVTKQAPAPAAAGQPTPTPAPPNAFETFPGVPPPPAKEPAFTMGSEDSSSSVGKIILMAVIVVVVLGGAAAAGFFLFQSDGGKPAPASSTPEPSQSLPGMPVPPPDAPGAPAAVAAPDLAAFVGPWENEDSLTRDKTRIEIVEEGGGLKVQMFERSTPGEKEMGSTIGFLDPATGAVALTWTLPDKTEQQHLKLLQDGRLKLWGSVQFTRGSARVSREYDNYFKRFVPPAPTEEELKAAEKEKAKEKAKPAKGKKGRRGR